MKELHEMLEEWYNKGVEDGAKHVSGIAGKYAEEGNEEFANRLYKLSEQIREKKL